MNFWTNSFWRRWTLVCGLAEFFGIGVAGLIAGLSILWVGEPANWPEKIINMLAMLLAGGLEGWLIGHFQAKILKEKIPDLSRTAWTRATIWVAVGGWFLGMLPSTLMPGQDPAEPPSAEPVIWVVALFAVLSGLALGAVFGWVQYFVLRRYLKKAKIWIIANALAWGAGFWWVFLGASWPNGGEPIALLVGIGIVSGSLMGLTVGAVTGWFLVEKMKE